MEWLQQQRSASRLNRYYYHAGYTRSSSSRQGQQRSETEKAAVFWRRLGRPFPLGGRARTAPLHHRIHHHRLLAATSLASTTKARQFHQFHRPIRLSTVLPHACSELVNFGRLPMSLLADRLALSRPCLRLSSGRSKMNSSKRPPKPLKLFLLVSFDALLACDTEYRCSLNYFDGVDALC